MTCDALFSQIFIAALMTGTMLYGLRCLYVLVRHFINERAVDRLMRLGFDQDKAARTVERWSAGRYDEEAS